MWAKNSNHTSQERKNTFLWNSVMLDGTRDQSSIISKINISKFSIENNKFIAKFFRLEDGRKIWRKNKLCDDFTRFGLVLSPWTSQECFGNEISSRLYLRFFLMQIDQLSKHHSKKCLRRNRVDSRWNSSEWAWSILTIILASWWSLDSIVIWEYALFWV